jgi:hypothetical protein
MVEQARALAERLMSEHHDAAERLQRAYRLLYSREPTEDEAQLGRAFLTANGANATASVDRLQQYVHILLAANELLYVD